MFVIDSILLCKYDNDHKFSEYDRYFLNALHSMVTICARVQGSFGLK